MIAIEGLSGELADLGRALGALNGNAEFDPDWLADPLDRLETILSDAGQRAALLRLLDALVPPAAIPGLSSGEKWHPLLGPQPQGNVYLTVRETGGDVVVGVAAELGSEAGPGVQGRMRAQIPLVRAGGSVAAVAGTSQGPLIVDLRIDVGWIRNPTGVPPEPVGLRAVAVRATFDPNPSLTIVLEQLQLDDRPAADKFLDPASLGRDAPDLIAGLLKEVLARATPSPQVTVLAEHLLGLFGLAESEVPAFPFAQIADGPVALQRWLDAMLVSGSPTAPIRAWLRHLAGLIGTAATTAGDGTETNPWRIGLVPFGTDAELALTASRRNGTARFGVLADVRGTIAGGPVLALESAMAIADIPLAGTSPARPLPDGALRLSVSGNAATPLVDNPATLRVGSIVAGIEWNGAALDPLLALVDVRFGGASYPRLDLTNVDSVVDAAANAVLTTLANALGPDVGRHLAALTGIAAASDPADLTQPLAGWPHHLHASRLVTDPAGAFGAYHRDVLLSATHGWDFLLRDLAALLGLEGAVSGSGTRADPWRVALAEASSGAAVELAAWNDAAGSPPADPQKLRLGIRLAAGTGPVQVVWLAELLAFDLPASGSASIALVGAQRLSLPIAPAFDGPLFGDVTATVEAVEAEASWQPGASLAWGARAVNVRIVAPEGDVLVPALAFPPSGGFDVNDLPATAAGLGVNVSQLESLLRLLLAHLASAAAVESQVIAACLGLHRQLPQLGASAPTLDDPAAPGRLLSDPVAALRGWLRRATDTVTAEGHAHVPQLLAWAAALLADELPDVDAADAPALDGVDGSGTFDRPWQLRWPGSASDGPVLQLWLEPAGPPSTWAAGLAARSSASEGLTEISSVLRALAAFSPAVTAAISGRDSDGIASVLDALDLHLSSSDGVVPMSSQSPPIFGWDHGDPLTSAHHELPRDPAAIAQILGRIDDLAGGAGDPRVVLLLGPSFGSAQDWDALLASPARHGVTNGDAHFDLRLPGADPLTLSLDGVTAGADYYTADLADNGSGDLGRLVTQIDRIVSRLLALRGNVPVTLVGHSTAGLAARAFAATHSARVKGLITLGTPHLGALLPFLTDAFVGDAVRIAQSARGGTPSTTPLRQALDHLVVAMDGYAGGAAATLPRRQPYPFASFNTVGPFDTGDVPVLALGSTLGDTLLDVLKTDTQALAASFAALSRTASHLSGGIALPLDIAPARGSEAHVDATLRVGLFQIALQAGSPPPTRARHTLRAEARVHRGEGWLLGGPSTFPIATAITDPLAAFVDVRAREISIGLDLPALEGTVPATPWFSIGQGAFRGPTRDRLTDADALGHEVLGAALHDLSAHAAGASPAQQLLDALRAVDLVVADADNVVGLSADAWLAMGADPLTILGAKIPDALAAPGGWLGLQGPADGPWVWTPAASPLELVVSRGTAGTDPGWRLALRSTSATVGAEESLLRLDVDYASGLPVFAPTAGIALGIGPVSLRYDATAGTLNLQAPPWLDDLRLVPSTTAELGARLNDALPRVLFSGALSVGLSAIAPTVRVAAVERFLRATGDFLQSADAFGRADGPGFNGEKITQLLRAINDLAGLPAGPGLQLPGSLSIVADGVGTEADLLSLSLATTAAIGGVLDLAAGLRFDHLGHALPTGTITLDTPLSGAWPHIAVRFGVDAHGLTLSVLPQGQPEIQILPTFSGLGALRGAAAALLPQVLDALVQEFGSPPPSWLARLLDVAAALQLYDDVGHFTAHAAELRALLAPNWRETFDASLRGAVATAAVALVNEIPALPGAATAAGGLFTWSVSLGAPDKRVGVSVGWTGDDPAVRLFAEHMELATGAVGADFALGVGPAGIECEGSLAASLSAIGLAVRPTLSFSLDAGTTTRFNLRALPLADATGDGPLEIVLAPEPAINAGADTPLRLITDWAVPLLVHAVIESERAELARQLWTDGPTVQDALRFAGLLDGTGVIVAPLPSLGQMTTGLLTGLGSGEMIPFGTMQLGLVSSGGRVGLRVAGHQNIGVGSLELSVRFGAPTNWTAAAGSDEGTPGADGGLELLLLRTGVADIELDVGVLLAGVGIGLAREDGTKLVDTSLLRIGELRAYLFMDVETTPSLDVSHLGAGAELIGFGLPLGAATSGNVGGDNPVAANLLRSNGASGDSRPVNPDVDIDVWYWQPEGSTGAPFHLRFGGETGTIWIGVHAGFGPIYIDQVGIAATSDAASLLIDGGISVAGLSAQVDDLTVRIPYAQLSDPTHWSLDLRGLGLGFTAPGVVISGALVKYDGPPIEYDGMLLIKLAQIGAIAVGSYSVVGTGAGEYTSIAIFGGVFVPVGVPPIINITGLGIGLGYNRRLVVPEDLNEIPGFFMIQALDDPEAIANNPMQALFAFRDSVPASRGSLWLAAGLRGTSFEIVHVTAVLYAALDRGVEIGLLGVARMALPSDDAPLASVELALKARFSTAEALFSVQAQLTDNSWLLSRDCQLTGGFAYFMWFRESQFLLTLGGYHPAFQKRPEYPVVPRLGYHWNYLGIVQLKGESYFALTNTCVMAGMRMEATYGRDWLQLWFTGYADLLVSWEPFHYDARVGIAVGARVRIRVCFFKCVRITVSVSVGADLHLEGPPLHGTAEIDLCVASVTIPFGSTANPQPPALPWEAFRLKYLMGSDPATLAVSAQVASGLLPAEPPGAKVAAGTQAEPWRIAAEWMFRTETRMPARGFAFQTDDAHAESEMPAVVFGRYTLSGIYAFDIAPMYVASSKVGSIHRLVLSRKPEAGGAFSALVPRSAPALPADHTFILDERMFRMTPVVGQVSEATYHFFPDLKPPAAANTLPVLTGLEVQGVAFLEHPSAVIPIAKLRDASNPRPLPFAHDLGIFVDWRTAGIAAEQFAALAEGRTSRQLLDAYAHIVSGAGEFSTRRVQSNLPAEGLPPVAARTLRTRRSSPPVLSTLSFGLAMRPVEQPLPAPVREVVPRAPVALDAVRLRAVMQQQIAPTGAAPPAIRSTVARVASAVATPQPPARVNVGRDLLRIVSVPGARLVVQPHPAAPRATRFARTAMSIRSGEIGATVGRGTARTIAQMEKAAAANGATLRVGVTQLWDVPPARERTVRVTGGMAVRVTQLGGGGAVISDVEYPDARDLEIVLHDDCAMVALTGLGRVPRSPSGAANSVNPPGAGAVTAIAAPYGATPAVGWELRQSAAQLSPTVVLGRGVLIELSQRAGVHIAKQTIGTGMISLAEALRGQTAIQTTLPAGTGVVGVLLDLEPGRVLAPADLVIASAGSRLAADPIRVEGGNRALLLYDVSRYVLANAPTSFSVTVAVRRGGRCAGVVGLGGDARTWGERMNGRIPERLVPDEPLTTDGEAQVRFVLHIPEA